MLTLAQIQERLVSAVPGAHLEVVSGGDAGQTGSLRVDRAHAFEAARWLRDAPELRFDYASNVTGVDWLDSVTRRKVKVLREVDGVTRELEDEIQIEEPGHLEVVYHLFSMALGHGPLVLRVRTENRTDRVRVPSLTPVWRSCELQEREVYDLFGVVFDGHPDLRRLLMWEGFQDHPMRKDYVPPDDYEYEPTPHDAVLERARAHQASEGSP